MKNKLALGLAHLIGPHKGDVGFAGASPPPSPYPGRRAPLPPRVEADLRAACTGVLTNTKPSHHYVAEDQSRAPKPQLDYEAIKRSASTRKSVDSRPNLPATENVQATHPVKYAYRPDAPLDHLFPPGDSTHNLVQASILRPKDEAPASARSKPSVPINVMPSDAEASQRPRPSQRSLSAETSHSTPHTDGTEYPWSISTAPTSAAITPARTSKRASSHIQADQDQSSKSHATAIEWMRIELERRRKKQAAADDPPLPPSESRAPSRARSIRNGLKEYIRPSTAGSASRESSRAVTRSASRASMRTTASSDPSQDPSIRGGWRSWGRSRKDDGRSDLSRSNSTRGRSETRKESASNKSELNLNRELPPLPGLDQWKESGPVPANPKHAKGSKSVDSMMSEKDEIVAARLGSPAKEKPDVYVPLRSPKSSSAANTSTISLATAHTRDHLGGRLRPENAPQRSRSTTRPHSRVPARPLPTSPQAEHSSTSLSRNRSVNYSRVHSPTHTTKPHVGFPHISKGFSKHRNYDSASIPPALASSKAEKASHKSTYEQKYRHVMDVLSARSPPPVPPKDDRKWWNLKSKSKKPSNWMDQLEKMGIKDGVLVNDEACGAPVIRY